jgi:hypothetical protein
MTVLIEIAALIALIIVTYRLHKRRKLRELTGFERSLVVMSIRATIEVIEGRSPNKLDAMGRQIVNNNLARYAFTYIMETVISEVNDHNQRKGI